MEPKLTPTFKDLNATVGMQQYYGSNISAVTQFPPQKPEVAPVEQPKREKVAIIGTAPSSRMLAPFADLTWDIWACSPGNMNTLPRVDAWFEIHQNLHWPEYEAYGKPYIDWLSKQTFPVYMQDQFYFPHALTFPKDDLIRELGENFWSSSFAWMMGMAIFKGYKQIGMFGVDMASKDEYIQQRPGFKYFQEKAEERGIVVTAPYESDILRRPALYGYSEVTPRGRKLHARKQELFQRVAALERNELPAINAKQRETENNITYLKGALEDNDYELSIWPD